MLDAGRNGSDRDRSRGRTLTDALPDNAEAGDPLPLAVRRSPVWRWATPILSLAILFAVGWQLRTLNVDQLRDLVPTYSGFWIVFLLYYFAPVAADFAIFERLWKIPAEGFVALTRKLIGNELLLDYVGDVYFYGWARKKVAMTASPFGAVKDAAILSALVANAVTLAMIAIAYPLIGELKFGIATEMLILSLAVIILVSMLALVFGKRLFSLSKSELWMISGVHLARILATTGLAALAWSLSLPEVALSWWIVLATVRLLLSRLPFLPNKDLVFAGVAVFMVGHDTDISQLMALWAALILAGHLVVGAVLAIGDFVTVGGRTEPRS